MLSTLKSVVVRVWRTVFTISTLFTISVISYVLFYQWNIPESVVKHRIYFQHDPACHQLPSKSLDSCNIVHADLDHLNRDYFFKFDQRYHFTLKLVMPDSPVNRALGMFMVKLKLLDQDDQQLFSVTRPALIPYSSGIVRLAQQIFYLVPLVLELSSEVHSLGIDLMDEDHSREDVPFFKVNKLHLELVTYREMEIIPPSELIITTQMEGIQYWMFVWKYTCATMVIYTTFATLASILTVCKLCTFVASHNGNNSSLMAELIDSQQSDFGGNNPRSSSSQLVPLGQPVLQQQQQEHHDSPSQTCLNQADSSSSLDDYDY